jgi:hypothetical protein
MTTTPGPLPTAWARLEAALRARHPVLVCYHGRQRVICPHALGWKAGRPLLLGYQTGGQTSTGALPADPQQRWRCLYIDEIDQVVAENTGCCWGTADNYNHSHPFPAIDEVTIAITPATPYRPVR